MQDLQNQPQPLDRSGTALPLRNDTMLGVCQGLGEDLRINPNIFRLLFGALIFWNVWIAVGAYLGAGLIVAASRYFFPPKAVAERSSEAAPGEAGNSEAEMQIAA